MRPETFQIPTQPCTAMIFWSARSQGTARKSPFQTVILKFAANDIVSIVAKRRDAIDFFRKIGLEKNRVSNTIIAGGGKISYYLAKSLLMSGIKTTIIEIKPAAL